MVWYLMKFLCHLCPSIWTNTRGLLTGKGGGQCQISSPWILLSTLHHSPTCSVLLDTDLYKSHQQTAIITGFHAKQEIRGQKESEVGYLLSSGKITSGWLCLLFEGHRSWQVSSPKMILSGFWYLPLLLELSTVSLFVITSILLATEYFTIPCFTIIPL